jgi:hypothetical protein
MGPLLQDRVRLVIEVRAVSREVLWPERVEQRDELGAAARSDESGELGVLIGGLVRARSWLVGLGDWRPPQHQRLSGRHSTEFRVYLDAGSEAPFALASESCRRER